MTDYSLGAALAGLQATPTEPWAATQIPLGDGRFDLLAPDPGAVDLPAMADRLAKIARFGGGTPSEIWSVAAHSVLVEQVLIHRRPAAASARLCCLALLHDFHEAAIGDLTRQLRTALIRVGGPDMAAALQQLTAPIDAAIWQAVGIDPPDAAEADLIAQADSLAAAIEWRALIPHPDRPADMPDPPRWSALRPQPWPMDAAALLDRLAARATDLTLTGPAIAALRVR
ncbi:MAG: hypothetical protein R8L07_03635 [Alphaproteobacteria bacterium]|nr:hypothetical protein [Alphaproteobacteria bacterium]